MAPIPAHSATVIASGTLAKAVECASQLIRANLLPTAIYLHNSSGAASWKVAVSFDGFAETVARQTNELMEMAQRLGLTGEVINGEKQQCWQTIADLPVNQDRLIYRLTVPRGALTQSISTLVDWTKVESPSVICADVAMGTLWLAVPADPTTVGWFPRLITLAQEHGGHAIIFAAPAPLKKAIDVWGSTAPAHTLMRKIKQEFDPSGLFNPGRFIGGL